MIPRNLQTNVLWRTEIPVRMGYPGASHLGCLQDMSGKTACTSRILVVEDVQETRDSIKRLLRNDGYRVDAAPDEDEALDKIERNPPDLILISLDGLPEEVFACAQRIRHRGGLSERTPIVIFSLAIVPEGGEEELMGNIHVIMPDNFNHLRGLLKRVLRAASRTH